jgi:hypothetical protein
MSGTFYSNVHIPHAPGREVIKFPKDFTEMVFRYFGSTVRWRGEGQAPVVREHITIYILVHIFTVTVNFVLL